MRLGNVKYSYYRSEKIFKRTRAHCSINSWKMTLVEHRCKVRKLTGETWPPIVHRDHRITLRLRSEKTRRVCSHSVCLFRPTHTVNTTHGMPHSAAAAGMPLLANSALQRSDRFGFEASASVGQRRGCVRWTDWVKQRRGLGKSLHAEAEGDTRTQSQKRKLRAPDRQAKLSSRRKRQTDVAEWKRCRSWERENERSIYRLFADHVALAVDKLLNPSFPQISFAQSSAARKENIHPLLH